MAETKSELTKTTSAGCVIFVWAIIALVVGIVHLFFNYDLNYGFLVPGHLEFFVGCVIVFLCLMGVGWYIGGKQEKIKESIDSEEKRTNIEENVKDKLKDF